MKKYTLGTVWPHRWGRWEYLLRRDGSVCLKGYGGSRDELQLPREICGLPVTAIGRHALSGEDACIITLPDTVTDVGPWAFAYCDDLQAVVIPPGVQHIDDTAFEGSCEVCLYVEEGSVAHGYALKNGLAFETTGMPEMEETNLSWCMGDWLCDLTEDGGVLLREYGGTAERLEIPEEVDGLPVRMIGSRCFSGNDFLREAVIPRSVTHIGHFAFADCDWLTAVHLPDSVGFLGGGCFANCRDLTDVRLPAQLGCIQLMTFTGCAALEEIRLPDGPLEIEPMAFCGCRSLRTVQPGTGPCTVDHTAFGDCPALQLPEELTGGDPAE